MKHIAGWFRRNNLLMAQAKDLQRQLTEAWYDVSDMREARDAARAVSIELAEAKHYITEQLHRVAQERDEERRLRIDAEVALLDKYLDVPEDAELEQLSEELRDVYLEQAKNEEE